MIIDRFPVAAIRRFTWRVSIDTAVREHLRNFCFRERTFFTVTDLYVKRSHCFSKDLYWLTNSEEIHFADTC